ncbi:hypothetical protein IQ07DRAFT_334005 [Pyrenochaeta sp. DS3sAY3a]|nr:hypothetical protein IQ07DRAFT_334005 [Pyrenochaeta sp. DS3sAY3a]
MQTRVATTHSLSHSVTHLISSHPNLAHPHSNSNSNCPDLLLQKKKKRRTTPKPNQKAPRAQFGRWVGGGTQMPTVDRNKEEARKVRNASHFIRTVIAGITQARIIYDAALMWKKKGRKRKNARNSPQMTWCIDAEDLESNLSWEKTKGCCMLGGFFFASSKRLALILCCTLFPG